MEAKSVLIIDDDELNMKLVKTLLQLEGYHILEARDAETGIRMARENHPDLILMDIQLPGMDGISATRKIRKDKGIKDIPIVALSSYAMQRDKEKAEAAGCTGYITKPIDTRTFSETLTNF